MCSNLVRVIAVSALLSAGQSFAVAQSVSLASQDPPKQVSMAEIQKLIEGLGSTSFSTRQSAMQRLRKIPKALSPLRRGLDGKDLETRRAMELLIAELTRKLFHQRLADLAKEKSDAQIDLLMDLMAENRQDVGEEQWRQTIEIVTAIADKLTKGTKIAGKVPSGLFDLRKCENLSGSELLLSHEQFVIPYRIIGDRLVARGPGISKNVAILSTSLQSADWLDCIVLTHKCILPGRKSDFGAAFVTGCFVYCDGNVNCDIMNASVVITRGQVLCATHSANNVLIENAGKSTAIKLFCPETVGFRAVQEGKYLRVENTLPRSRAEKSGLKAGDSISIDEKADASLFAFERLLRRNYAKATDMELTIRRDGDTRKIVLSFAD